MKFLEQEKTNNTAKFSGLISALSFREIPEDWSEIKSKLSSKNGLDQLSAAFTIRVLDNSKQTTSIPASLSVAILDHIIENRNSEVKKQLVWFFISNFNPADKRTSKCVTTIFHDLKVLGNALDALSIDNPVPKDIRFEILEKASDFEDRYILHKISRCIAIWGKDDVARSLKLCKNIALINHHHIPGELIWGIEEMSKESIDESLDVVESWLSERISEGERILRERFLYPEFLIVLTINDRNKLVKRLVNLSQKESNNDLVIETIHEYIETIPRKKDWSPMNDQDGVCLQSCVDSLKTIALRMGKDAGRFPNKKRKKIFQCGEIVELIKEVEHEPVPSLVKAARDYYSNIKRFIAVSVNEMEFESPPPTPFFKLLGSDKCNYREYLQRIAQAEIGLSGGRLEVAKWTTYDALMRHGLLRHIDNCLVKINETESGTSEIRKKLLHPDVDQFGSALSEIEVIGRLRARFAVDISELTEVVTEDGVHLPKRPDLSVHFGVDSIRIEVITPQMAAILRYLRGGVISNRLTGKILSEFHKHFKGQTDDKEAMIIVDTGRSEIDSWSAISSMRGTPSIQFLYNKESGRVVAERSAYAGDSVTDIDPETNSILGVLLYKGRMSKEGHLLLVGKFYPNIHSRAPNKMMLCRRIEEQLLDFVEAEPRI